MLTVVRHSWALLLGMFFIMIGNGMQGSALGLRGGIEAFDPTTMGFVMSGYFLGFLGGAQVTPWLLRRVGHVRVFAALGSLISAAFILFAAVVDPVAWTLMRFVVGFCYSGVYVVAESWLNEDATNDNRGQAMSAYIIVQMMGIILGQGLLNVADPGGYNLFVIMSVLVSVSFMPILLSAGPAPAFLSVRRMSMVRLFRTSPLGCVGTLFLGGIFACLFGMGAVYGTQRGLSTAEISVFVGAIYLGGLILQYPIGWLSDRTDRRRLIAAVTGLGLIGALGAVALVDWFPGFVVCCALVGGTANPLYSLIIAHTNDFLEPEDMASASGGLIVLNGVGAAGTPILVGWLMKTQGAAAFWLFIAAAMAAICLYALYRMTRRPAKSAAETRDQVAIGPNCSPVAAQVAHGAPRAPASGFATADATA